MLPKAAQVILKAFLKNPNNITLRRETFKKLGQENWERGKFNDSHRKFLAKEQNTTLKNINKRTGMKEGVYNPKKDSSVGWKTEEFRAGQQATRLENIAQGKGMNLPNVLKDPTIEKEGMEGLIRSGLAGEKSSLGTSLYADKSFIKGICL